MPFTVQINVALRERICQKIGSERVKKNNDVSVDLVTESPNASVWEANK